jgi:hypothetical protein
MNDVFYAVRADVLRRTTGARVQRVVMESVKRRLSAIVEHSPESNEVSVEAEESPLLEAITRERLVKTQQTGNTACAIVICKVWRSAIAL